jgi:nitrate reductase cytochrome c-type subunit
MVNRDVEQHDKQRADSPYGIQCLKSTRSVNRCLSCHGTPDRWLIQFGFS